MPEYLDRAVDARIHAYHPDSVPPFDTITARKRWHDRRRAGSAVAVAALTAIGIGIGIVVLPGMLGGSQSDDARLTTGPTPASDSEAHRYRIGPTSPSSYTASVDAQTKACLALPGTSDLAEIASLPPSYQVTVTGTREVVAFRECVGDISAVVLSELPLPHKDGLLDVTGVLYATGGPAGSSQAGLPGQVVLEGDNGRFTTEANGAGKFSVRVPPGDYTATGTSPQYGEGQGQCRAEGPVSVTTTDLLGVVIACSRR
jgi:hypothetical protein